MKGVVLIVAAICCFVFNTNAKTDSTKVAVEAGLNVFQISSPREIMNGGSYLYKDKLYNIPSGLTLKFRFSKTALFYSADFAFYSYKIPQDNYIRVGNHNFQEMRIGFEFLIGKSTYQTVRKIIPYGRIDFHLAVGNDKGNKSGVPYDDKIREFGLGPTFGLRYNFNERWSISSEVSGSLAIFSYDKIGQYPVIKLLGGHLNLPRFVGVNYVLNFKKQGQN